MISNSLWIYGPSRSGKTTRLVELICEWLDWGINRSINNNIGKQESLEPHHQQKKGKLSLSRTDNLYVNENSILVLSANDDNRRVLADRIAIATQGRWPIRVKTPLGFFQDEVVLFWPLLVQVLGLKGQFPVRLRPETEQELATKLWRSHLHESIIRASGVNEYRLVRRILDILQLAALAGVESATIGEIIAQAIQEDGTMRFVEPDLVEMLLTNWKDWCLQRGFLTYGIICGLYRQHLLEHPEYQQRLLKRYQGLIADDVGDYPAIARDVFEVFLAANIPSAFTYNPDSNIRWGLGADPDYLQELAAQSHTEILTPRTVASPREILTTPMLDILRESIMLYSLPSHVQSIQTTSRSQLLRTTAEHIIHSVKTKGIAPRDIAIIAPGLDAIARYTLTEILLKQDIPVQPLNDQRPLIANPAIRGLLTLLALVYPGLGRLIDRDTVAEMLVSLSYVQKNTIISASPPENTEQSEPNQRPSIDPVRAGLIADHCFQPHPDTPSLLPITSFDRWDRLGYAAASSYNVILSWIENQRQQYENKALLNPVFLIDRAIQDFLWNGSNLPYAQLAALRELLETAQHYWEIDTRLQQYAGKDNLRNDSTLIEFIQLLRRGTITANPYPIRPIGRTANAVTLASIFQYRSQRRAHRYHYWLDASSPLWAKGGAATLFGATFFLQNRLGQPWTTEDEARTESLRVQTIITDLLARVEEQIYLCHSELAVNGQEQIGPLTPLVHACVGSDILVS